MTASSISIRFAEEKDSSYLTQWLLQPGVLRWFPLKQKIEVDDAVRVWMSYTKQKAVLMALYEGVPCGSATLYLAPFRKLSRQCLFGVIVDEAFRGRGVGGKLISELTILAKERFQISLLHLEVYEGNPGIRLYERLGFVQYGYQRHFIKDEGEYLGKILMQKLLKD